MSRSHRVPSYRLHKQSGQAVVTLADRLGDRRDVLLGRYGTAESRTEYARRVIAEWEANGRRLPQKSAAPDVSVNEVMLAYTCFVDEYYRHPDGTPTSEAAAIKLALRRLKALYGLTPVADFDSLSLEALRKRMIEEGLCRNRINKDVARIKRLFKWAASKKVVPLAVHQSLQTVEGLRGGRSAAVETEPVRPVAPQVVEGTLPHLLPPVAAMVRLQLLTGMRPGEAVVMRTIDLDTSSKVWLYRPGSDRGALGQHKTAHQGHRRVIALGPQAQEVLRPHLRLNLHEYLFQPREAMAAFRAEQRKNRKSKVQPSQQDRKRRKPRKQPGERYTVSSYDNAIARGIRKANIARACDACKEKEPDERCAKCQASALPHWHPHQLRHTKATELRRVFGLDAARVVLGHRSPQITEVYAELDVGKAMEVMERLG